MCGSPQIPVNAEFYHPKQVKTTPQIGKIPHVRWGHFDMMGV